MNLVLDKRQLGPEVFQLEVQAPRIQKRWKAGQFIILRPLTTSERIPLTLVDSDAERQSVTLVIQAIGNTTKEAVALEPGEFVADVVGPLGEPASMSEGKRVVCMAGGVGVAEVLPVARAFKDHGNHVTALWGALGRTADSRRGAEGGSGPAGVGHRRRDLRIPRQRAAIA